MESSTLCKDTKKHQRCSNPSHSNLTETTSAMEELVRKNKGVNQKMTPRSRFQEFPLLSGGIDWGRL
jgi:hypothetical protein